MNLFTVDEQKCNRDALCVTICSRNAIEMKGKDAVPTPTDDAEEMCINCGHCVAICPKGALSHRIMKAEECVPMKKNWRLDPDKLHHYMQARRSARHFKDQSVEREVMEKLIDCARYAPTGHNNQTVKWLVIHDSNEVHRMAGMAIDWTRHTLSQDTPAGKRLKAMHFDRSVTAWEAGIDVPCRHAPHVVMAYASDEASSGPTDCIIALTHLELAAPAFGLGACWGMHFNHAAAGWPPLQKALGLSPGHTNHGAMLIGYPKYRFQRVPLRTDARIAWR